MLTLAASRGALVNHAHVERFEGDARLERVDY